MNGVKKSCVEPTCPRITNGWEEGKNRGENLLQFRLSSQFGTVNPLSSRRIQDLQTSILGPATPPCGFCRVIILNIVVFDQNFCEADEENNLRF